MKKLISIIKKTLIGVLCITLSYLAIYSFYDHSQQIAMWFFKSDTLFFEILFKFMGIVWSAAFLRVGSDWVISDINPFKKQNYEVENNIEKNK